MSKYLLFRERGNTHCGMKITPVTITLSARFDKEEDAIIIDFKDSSTEAVTRDQSKREGNKYEPERTRAISRVL